MTFKLFYVTKMYYSEAEDGNYLLNYIRTEYTVTHFLRNVVGVLNIMKI